MRTKDNIYLYVEDYKISLCWDKISFKIGYKVNFTNYVSKGEGVRYFGNIEAFILTNVLVRYTTIFHKNIIVQV